MRIATHHLLWAGLLGAALILGACQKGDCPNEVCAPKPITCGGNSVLCDLGETVDNCPEDCNALPAICGDGTCDRNELCVADCAAEESCGNGFCGQSENCTTCAEDCGCSGTCQQGSCVVCGDFECDPAVENSTNCPEDCYCGDGVCADDEDECDCYDCGCECGDGFCDFAGGENCTNCATDCSCSGCGNGECDPGEDCNSCFEDCGECSGFCPDGICDELEGENCDNCAADCCGGGGGCYYGCDCLDCPEFCSPEECGGMPVVKRPAVPATPRHPAGLMCLPRAASAPPAVFDRIVIPPGASGTLDLRAR